MGHSKEILIYLFHIVSLVNICDSQAIPQCITSARTTGKLVCDTLDFTGFTNASFTSISNTQISTVELIGCTIANLDFLNNINGVQLLILNSMIGLKTEHFRRIAMNKWTSTLEQITLENNRNLGAFALNDLSLRKLKKLEVKGCDISSVDSNLYNKAPEINYLDLSNNQLVSIDFTNHASRGSLQTIILANNNLQAVNGLSGFYNLQRLDISNNQLRGAFGFDALIISSQLTHLDLSQNQLTSFELAELTVDILESAHDIDTINLEDNKIAQISNLPNSAVRKVRALNLGKNFGLQIKETTLSGLPELRQLKLHETGLSQIGSQLINIQNLQKLYLENNRIEDMSQDSFAGTHNLQVLMLQRNKLTKLPFLSSQTKKLEHLKVLDISYNKLDYLENFVAAPNLEILRMDGSQETNRFSELSGCNRFTQIPNTLKVVCARSIPTDDCKYRTFVNLLRNKVLYNHHLCCNDPDNPCCNDPKNCNSNWPKDIGCRSQEEECSIVNILPGKTTPEHSTIAPSPLSTESIRSAFSNLYDSEKIVIVMGYLLAVMFLILVIILCVRRARSYDKWLKDYRDVEAVKEQPIQQVMNSDSNDAVDGKCATMRKGSGGSPRPVAAGTLPKSSPKFKSKSLDTLSVSSGHSHYSTIGKNAFAGRDKFKENSIPIDSDERYTAPGTSRRHPSDVDDGEESPTELSTYSYASNNRLHPQSTLPNGRRRHRSGSSLPKRRSKSEDLLDTVSIDMDLVPPKILLQRQASDQPDHQSVGKSQRQANGRPDQSRHRVKSSSPHLTVRHVFRNPGAPTPPMNRRALPTRPDEERRHKRPLRSHNQSMSSSGDSSKNGSVFAMDTDDTIISFERPKDILY